MVPRSHWENYPINVSQALANRVIVLLRDHQFRDVEADPTFDWHDDTITPAKWMFSSGTPPTTVVSLNARFNPAFHVKIGMALGKLRQEGILIVGTGGAVHNLYRNNWLPLLRSGDNFQPSKKPAQWALEFSHAVTEVIKNNEVSFSSNTQTRQRSCRVIGPCTSKQLDSVDTTPQIQRCASDGRPLLSPSSCWRCGFDLCRSWQAHGADVGVAKHG